MSRVPRDREDEHAAIKAATERLLTGIPLRSTSGKLTASELITESGVRRDIVYANHKDLVEAFQVKVKAQNSTPLTMQQLADEHAALQEKLTEVKTELAAERAAGAALRRMVAELSLELQHAHDELTTNSAVTPLRPSRRSTIIGPC